MNFLQKLKLIILNFMRERYGVDELSKHMLWLGIGLYIVSAIVSSAFMSLFSLLIYFLVLFRMFSKNRAKRFNENIKYLELKSNIVSYYKQSVLRFKNRKDFKYIKCKKCKTILRVPRKLGKISISCTNCGEKANINS